MRKGYLEELAQLQRRFSRILEDVVLGSELAVDEAAEPGTWSPPVDVVETDEGFQVTMELPGVEREDIELEASERRLEVTGRRRPPGGEARFHRMEGRYGPFRRSIDLGVDIPADAVEAALQDGVLTVRIATTVRSRRIPVNEENQ